MVVPTQVAPRIQYFSGPSADFYESLLQNQGSQWILGAAQTQTDATASREMKALRPNPATHPNLFSWAAMVTKFSEAAMATWPAGDSNRVSELQTA